MAGNRFRLVEKDPGGGWIARHPLTGEPFFDKDWRWNSRSVARDVVDSLRRFPESKTEGGESHG